MGDVLIKARTRNNGKIVYEYRFEIAPVNNKRQWKTKSGFTTKKAAKEAGKLAQQEYENSGYLEKSADMSYSDFLDIWIEKECRLVCREITVNGYKKKIRLYIKPKLGEYRIKNLSKQKLQDFITDMYNEGFSINTISSIKGILTKSLGYAEDQHYIKSSPATKLKIPFSMQPQNTTRKKPHIYIKPDEVKKIFERFPEGHPSHIPLLIAYHTGLRLGEIFGLVWQDVNFEDKTLRVSRQVQWQQVERSSMEKKRTNGTSESGGYWFFAEPKYKSYRVIDIDDTLITALKKENEKQEIMKKYYKEYYTYYYSEFPIYYFSNDMKGHVEPINKISTHKTDYEVDFITRRENGTYISPRTLQHTSRIIHNELDIPNYDTHSFRHTHGTMLVEEGADMVYIQRRLGHKDINVTMNIYTNHLTDIIRNRNNDKLNNLFDKKED